MIEVSKLTMRVGGFALRGISFGVPDGAYGVLMGRTGSGKTTLLEALCGLKHVESGEIRLAGVDVTHLKPAVRGIGYVPQDGALFASMSVRDHLGFALRVRRWSPEDVARRINELAVMLSLEGLLDRGVKGLSGGEAQRVALGRALSFHPSILCLDEPLSALDDETRLEMYEVLERIRERTGVTVLHVTHNRSEARRLADQVYEISGGQVQRTK